MKRRFPGLIFNSLKADLKFIARDPMLIVAAVAPVFLIILLRLVFPPLAEFVILKTGVDINLYYPVVAITFISLIPMLIGMVYAFILIDENDMHILQVISVTPAGRINFILMRMVMPVLLSLFFIWIAVLFTDPVASEGWLRTLVITILLSTQSTFVFLFTGSMAGDKIEGLAFSKLYGIFLVAVPLGLVLHHPWNYLAFFSPSYWIAWSWVVPSPVYGIWYAVIATVLTSAGMIFLLTHFLKKQVA
ncbi:MAG TPA: hypothetical protein VJ963_15195 [Bacteroidales bacterium]|nr:hypothetical protein [Bacteroidales bacterium]